MTFKIPVERRIEKLAARFSAAECCRRSSRNAGGQGRCRRSSCNIEGQGRSSSSGLASEDLTFHSDLKLNVGLILQKFDNFILIFSFHIIFILYSQCFPINPYLTTLLDIHIFRKTKWNILNCFLNKCL